MPKFSTHALLELQSELPVSEREPQSGALWRGYDARRGFALDDPALVELLVQAGDQERVGVQRAPLLLLRTPLLEAEPVPMHPAAGPATGPAGVVGTLLLRVRQSLVSAGNLLEHARVAALVGVVLQAQLWQEEGKR